MLIKYNKENLVNFPVNNMASKTIKLMPGINEFPKEVFEALSSHPVVKLMVEDGDIEFVEFKKEVIEDGETKVVGPEDDELKIMDLNQKDAKKAIKETHNLSMLERWLAEETRVQVKKSIEDKIQKMNKPAVQKES